MQAVRARTMTREEFLAWERTQEEKHELIDGVPVPRRMRMMAGGTRRHALIAMNIGVALRGRLRGGPCVPHGSDLAVASPTGATRYPDVTVDCGSGDQRAVLAEDPRAIFEVLSPSNDTFQQTRLLHDYQAMGAVSHIVFVSQDAVFAQTWTREGAGWRLDEASTDGAIELTALQIKLPLAEVYESVVFEAPV